MKHHEDLADSLERIIPAHIQASDRHANASLALHLARYKFAAEFLQRGLALDIACGVGYGTEVLTNSRKADAVHGVDICPEAIRYAMAHFKSPQNDFLCEPAESYLHKNKGKYATVVSLETLEHLSAPAEIIHGIYHSLQSGGTAILSVPVSPTIDINPHHLHDFSRNSFFALLQKAKLEPFSEFEQVQHATLSELILRESSRSKSPSRNILKFYLNHPGSLARRLAACLRDGFSTRYLTVAARKLS